LDVDKSDLKRLTEFLNAKLYDLLVVAEAAARANGRDVIEPWDLPLTRGLRQSMHEFRALEVDLELRPILENLATLPPLDLAPGYEVERLLPEVVGAITLSLARTFKTIDPSVRNPRSEHWEVAFQIFSMLL